MAAFFFGGGCLVVLFLTTVGNLANKEKIPFELCNLTPRHPFHQLGVGAEKGSGSSTLAADSENHEPFL